MLAERGVALVGCGHLQTGQQAVSQSEWSAETGCSKEQRKRSFREDQRSRTYVKRRGCSPCDDVYVGCGCREVDRQAVRCEAGHAVGRDDTHVDKSVDDRADYAGEVTLPDRRAGRAEVGGA